MESTGPNDNGARRLTALVTGSHGFVGRHMVAELERRGYWVMGVDNEAPRPQTNDPWWQMDLRRYISMSDRHYDLIVHCAAVVGGRQMIEGAPLQLAVTDLELDAKLFDFAIRTNAGAVVYFSSSAAYPVALQTERGVPLHEDCIPRAGDPTDHWFGMPDATYGWVKLTGERLAYEANQLGLPTYVFRPFSGYGADQNKDYPFPTFIDRALRGNGLAGNPPFDVWGTGTQVRDFVHIDDVVDTVFAVMEAEYTKPVNIGTGIGTSFLDLAKLICGVGGYSPVIQTHADKPVGVQRRVADVTLMREFHTPKVSLREGVERALRAVAA